MLHAQINQVLERTEIRLRVARSNHLGYPYNLVPTSGIPSAFGDYLINNLGDPYTGSHCGLEVCDLEREAVTWLMALWQCDDPTAYWGSVGASGTEGNFWALYLAREVLPDGVLVHSSQAHYSIPKAARILNSRRYRLIANRAAPWMSTLWRARSGLSVGAPSFSCSLAGRA